MPINEPSYKPSKSIGDKTVCALGFEWCNRAWVKFTDNKYTMIAPSDNRPLNNVVPADQLPDFSLPFWGQHRRQNLPVFAYDLDASASTVPPPEPPASDEVTLQQLMDVVRTLSL